ncbi:MAG: cell division protein FtsW [Clostridia bacterium]|nr:cell division protein FtsW [Clostridia bacterium]
MNKAIQHSNPDYIVAVAVIVLALFGIIMVFSATYYSEQASGNTGEEYFFSQVIGVILGILVMLILSYIDYRLFKNKIIVYGLLIFSIVFLIVVYFTPKINGAHRWIDLGLFYFQPAEVARFAMIVFTAKTLSEYENLEIARSWRLKEVFSGLTPYFVVLVVISGLIVFEPSLTMTLMLIGAVFCMLIAAGMKWRLFFTMGTFAAIAGALAIISKKWRLDRVMIFMTPWEDATDAGYQLTQSLYALGSGGLFGVGLGNSKQKLLYLTYGDSDFILSIIGEELGFIGVSILLIVFIVLIVRCFVIALNSRDLFATILAVGIASTIAIQTVLNVGVATCSIPPTGVPLPFISSGNTSLVIFMAEMGILLNISRHTSARQQ